MAKTDFDALRPKIVAAWRTGEYSQRDLAKKFNVSAGYVAKLTKDVEQDCEQSVSAGVLYNQALADDDEHLVSAIKEVVDERTKHIMFFNRAALALSSAAVNRVQAEPDMPMADMRHASEIVAKQRDSILGKAPDNQTNVQINNQLPAVSVTFGD